MYEFISYICTFSRFTSLFAPSEPRACSSFCRASCSSFVCYSTFRFSESF